MVRRLFSRPQPGTNYSVVVVEDDLPILQVITELLQDDGYTVNAASTGEEALKLLESIPMPNVFVVDYMLPDMNGRQFIESIRVRFGQSKLPPVLMLTASKEGESIANALQLNDYLPKPFDNHDLLDHIGKLVQHTKEAK
jgi:CheY-like chemotaxis protein